MISIFIVDDEQRQAERSARLITDVFTSVRVSPVVKTLVLNTEDPAEKIFRNAESEI